MPSTDLRPRLVVGVTSTLTADIFLDGELSYLAERGFDVTLACGGDALGAIAAREGVAALPLALEREIRLHRDARALVQATRALRRIEPAAVLASTPKAGLVLTAAARLAGVPLRVYQIRGLRLESATGAKRAILVAAERQAMASATHLLAVSKSLRRRIVELGLHGDKPIAVLGAGSSHGVDLEHVAAATPAPPPWPDDAPVLGFVGRLTRDKGIDEFREVFTRVGEAVPEVRGLVLGDAEAGDPASADTLAWLRSHPRIHAPGFVRDTAPYYPHMDLLVFPSAREGFPNVPLEAAAAGVPTIGYAVTGTVDAVVSGGTGTLVPFGETAALVDAALGYLRDGELRRTHGQAALARARTHFSHHHVRELLADYLWDLVESGGAPATGDR